ncbi:MAG: hypothetical protein J6P66_06470 [Bacteroidaceae bacterium]|nr:hypothetical protein [Bacteroidaceae bacterium]
MNSISGAVTEIDVLTSAVGDAMAEVTAAIGRDGLESEDTGELRHLVEFIIGKTGELKELLAGTLDGILAGWNEIAGNEMLRGKVREYLELGMEFTEKADAFDVAVADCRYDLSAIVGESWFGRELLTVMCDWQKSVEPLMEAMECGERFEPRLADPFETAVRKLRPFFNGVGAEGLRALVTDGVSLAARPVWKADRRQAVVMGDMLGLSCRVMNQSFVFTGRSGQERPLKYSSDRPDLDYSCYEIYPILKELQDGMRQRNKRQRNGLKTS